MRAEDIQGGAVDLADVKFRIQPETHASLSRSHLHSGDLLITIAGTLGRVGYIPKTTTPINCNQAVAFARLKPDLADLEYVCYACQSAAVLRPLLDQQKLGTIGNLNLEQLNNLEIPLPDLSEQRRVAGELERADGLRRTRRYALELADTFLPAAFLQLFGTPTEAATRFPMAEIGEVVRFIDYRGIAPNKSESGVRLVTARNVKRGWFEIEPQEFIPTNEYESWMSRGMPRPGDVLFTTEGHTLVCCNSAGFTMAHLF